MKQELPHFIEQVSSLIAEHKGFEIEAFDLRGLDRMSDFTLIASGYVDRHLRAIASHLKRFSREQGAPLCRVVGLDDGGGWVLLDYLDLVVHLMTGACRERYQIEELWKEGRAVDMMLGEGR